MSKPEYKPISLLAVSAVITALVGTSSFLFAPFVVIPAIALLTSLVSIRAIRKYELAGSRSAVFAAAISVACVVFSPTWYFYLYHSEALTGHTRVEFNPTTDREFDQYNGQPVCVKGYSLRFRTGRKTILLSADGDFSKPGTMITVVVPEGWQHTYDALAVSGVLHVNLDAADPTDRYTISAAKISSANTSYLLLPRVPGDC